MICSYSVTVQSDKNILMWHTTSPGLIIVQNVFLLGVFCGSLFLEGAYYWREFCVSKFVALHNKNNSLSTIKIGTTSTDYMSRQTNTINKIIIIIIIIIIITPMGLQCANRP